VSHTYTGDPTNNPTSITLPDDNDLRSAASVNVPFEALADKVAYIQEHNIDSVAIDYAQPLRPILLSAEFQIDGAALVEQLTTGGQAILELELPQDAVLDTLKVHLKGATGHDPTLTGLTKPSATVSRLNLLNATSTIIAGPTDDPSTTDTAYQAIHTLTVDCGDELISRGQPHNPTALGTKSRYYVVISGEAGADFNAGLRIYGVSCQFTMSTNDPGAA
jgi:hypothetical protein